MPTESSLRFHSGADVLSARAAGTTVLLDRVRGRYFTLNEVAGRVWELAGRGATIAETIDRILGEYDVPRWQAEHDVAATLRQLLDDRLLAPGSALNERPVEPVPRRPPRAAMNAGGVEVPPVVRCGLLIAWFKALLRILGFLGTLEWIRKRVELLPATVEAEPETVKAVEYAVAMAGALYPGRAKCLEQSLTLYYLLRRSGVAAMYCQGVQPYPFQAHAWIEYRGEVINDVPEHARFFARLPEQLP
jgi:hypothetical protein